MIRFLSGRHREVYLTFDDGPTGSTEKVLSVLEKYRAHATFFVVGHKAKLNLRLLNEMKIRGHSFGNHSLDHKYFPFFRSRKFLIRWVREAEEVFHQNNVETVGFRPPAGVVTPPLVSVLKELNLPLILWNHRFFDTAFNFTEQKAVKSLEKLKPGHILLLHDAQRAERLPHFLKTLDFFISEAQKRGFEFKALNRKLCLEKK